MRIGLTLFLVLLIAFSLTACGSKDESSYGENHNEVNSHSDTSSVDQSESTNMKIKLILDHEEFIVTMYDNPTSQDFLARLPLTLTFEEYGGFEKLSILEQGLTTKDAPAGTIPESGDIGYYAPWKDINMYYTDWSYSSGLVKLGKIESNLEGFTHKLQTMQDDFIVTIKKVN